MLKREKITGKAGDERWDTAAHKISGAIIKWQTKWASWMQKQSERLSAKAKAILLVLFCLLTGIYCGWLVFSAYGHIDLKMRTISRPASAHNDDLKAVPMAERDDGTAATGTGSKAKK